MQDIPAEGREAWRTRFSVGRLHPDHCTSVGFSLTSSLEVERRVAPPGGRTAWWTPVEIEPPFREGFVLEERYRGLRERRCRLLAAG